MSGFFLKVVNMSISASWLVLAVLLARVILKKAPKWVSVLLWGFVAVRLICPISFESMLSLIPSAETISPEIMMDPSPEVYTGIAALNSVINPIFSESFTPDPGASANPLQIWIPLAAALWIAGIVAMLIYTAVSYILLRRKIATAVLLRNNVYQSENVVSPFVLGIIKPKIYLPFQMDGENLAHVIAHEQSHIRRKDHWWKPFGFLLLALHWFNPFIWLGYVLLCRDIELACDEKVIKAMDNEAKADYTEALVACSVSRRSIAACPLAFGEVGVKARVKSVMNYKKPAFWIIVAAVIICMAVAACFLTDPMDRISLSKLQWEEANMPGILDEVGSMTVTYQGVSVSCAEKAEINRFLATIEKIKVSKEPVSRNRSEDRSRAFSIKVNGNTDLNFNENFTQFWVDNHVKPSLTHRVTNPATAKELLLDYNFTASYVGGADDPNNITITPGNLSLNDVITLSQKGYDLGWSDFDQFNYYETGSGLYIRVYEINGLFEVWIGGSGPDSDPMYIYLTLADDLSQKMDIRDDGVTEFISRHNASGNGIGVDGDNNLVVKPESKLDAAISAAILDHNENEKPDGLFNTESHIILANEVVGGTSSAGQKARVQEETVFVYYLNLRFTVEGEQLEEHSGTYGQAIITFAVDETGEYALKDYRDPSLSIHYDEKLMKKFVSASEQVGANEEKYAEQLLNHCWETATEHLENLESAASAQPGGSTQAGLESAFSPIIDSISYDIDSDGKAELCTLTHGPTSGLFSFCLNVSPTETSDTQSQYKGTYILTGHYNLSFAITDDNLLRIKGEGSGESKEVVYFDITVKEGKILLECEKEGIYPAFS